jgi:acyl transferase domain-containing protein
MARAEKAEQAMWEFVSRAMKDPGRIVAGMDALIEQKRASMHGDPTREAKTWSEKLAEVVQERRGFQRLAAKGHMTDEELNEALLELEETRRTAERELEALRHRHEELEALERDRDAITVSWAAAVPDDLDRLTPEQRNTLYHMLRLEMRPTEEGYEITGPFVTEPLCTSGLLPRG